MKRSLALIVFALLVLGSVSAQISKGGTAWVQAKQAALKSGTWFFSGTRGTLQMGTQVSVLQVNGKWAEVRSAPGGALTGWIQTGNLSARRIVSSGAGASASEVALAGKGFNQEVENAYKSDGALNYADVDKTEAITVPQDDLYRFVSEGHLFTGEEE